MIKIPITNQPNQTFNISIPQGSTNIFLSFFIYWNAQAGYWEMSVSNANTQAQYINGLPMITGKSPSQNLLRQFEYLNIGQAYITPLTTATTDYPGVNDWDTNFILVWGP